MENSPDGDGPYNRLANKDPRNLYRAGIAVYDRYKQGNVPDEIAREVEHIIRCIRLNHAVESAGSQDPDLNTLADALDVPVHLLRGVRAALDDAGELGGIRVVNVERET